MCFWLHSVMVLSREYQFVFSWFNLKLNNTCCWWEGSNSIGAFSSMKPKNWSSNWCKTHVLGTKHMYLLEAKQRNDLQISLLFHSVRINFKNPRKCRWSSSSRSCIPKTLFMFRLISRLIQNEIKWEDIWHFRTFNVTSVRYLGLYFREFKPWQHAIKNYLEINGTTVKLEPTLLL